jgi:hypothetical protein
MYVVLGNYFEGANVISRNALYILLYFQVIANLLNTLVEYDQSSQYAERLACLGTIYRIGQM